MTCFQQDRRGTNTSKRHWWLWANREQKVNKGIISQLNLVCLLGIKGVETNLSKLQFCNKLDVNAANEANLDKLVKLNRPRTVDIWWEEHSLESTRRQGNTADEREHQCLPNLTECLLEFLKINSSTVVSVKVIKRGLLIIQKTHNALSISTPRRAGTWIPRIPAVRYR